MENNFGTVANGAPSWSSKLKKGFRVTGWFKRGEIEEMVRTAAAKSEAVDPFAGPVPADAVVEDSSLTAGDHNRLSLNTDGAQVVQVAQPLPAALTANRMSDNEMFAEIAHPNASGSRFYMLMGGCVIGLAAVIATGCYFLLH